MTKAQTTLAVDAGHPAVRIEVLDAGYQVRAKGYGRLEALLPTGLYNVRYRAADAMAELPITLRPNEPFSLTVQPELRFASAAPLELTSTSREYHQAHARRLSAAPPVKKGSGALFFLFIRDLDPAGPDHPARGLTLHGSDGKMLLRADRVLEVSTDEREARWAGRNIELDPGVYRLRLALQRRRAVEMSVVACPDWQTQVFLLRQPAPPDTGERPVLNLLDATQLMAARSRGFEPREGVKQGRVAPAEVGEDLRLAELARQALAHGRRAIGMEDLRALLDGKWHDPLLGIFGLHLLLMRSEGDLDLVDRVIARLRHEILHPFRHPDVEALAAEAARRRNIPIDVAPVAHPPMLRRSWEMLVRATAHQRSLIVPGSLAARIADRLWGSGAWLVWEAPPDARVRTRRGDSARSAVERLTTAVAPPRVEEYPDRVIIGGVTVHKHDVEMFSVSAPDEDMADEAPPGGGGWQVQLDAPVERAAAPSEPAPLQGILSSPDFPDVIRALVRNPRVTQEQLAAVEYTDLRAAVESLLPGIQGELERLGVEQFAQRAGLDTVEVALLVQFQGVRRPRRRAVQTPERDPLALATFVDLLGLPADRVHSSMAGLLLKLVRVLRRRR